MTVITLVGRMIRDLQRGLGPPVLRRARALDMTPLRVVMPRPPDVSAPPEPANNRAPKTR